MTQISSKDNGIQLCTRCAERSDLLKSPSFPTTVIFLIISCFLDLTIAEVLSVNLLKKAGGWAALGGEREPILQDGNQSHVNKHRPHVDLQTLEITSLSERRHAFKSSNWHVEDHQQF